MGTNNHIIFAYAAARRQPFTYRSGEVVTLSYARWVTARDRQNSGIGTATSAVRAASFAVTAFATLMTLSACGGNAEHFSRKSGQEVDAGPAGDEGTSPSAATSTASTPDRPRPSAPAEEDLEIFDDPGCPETIEPVVVDTCSPFETESSCFGDWSCFPYVEYPSAPCEPELYGTRCEPVGPGQQGDDCRSETCAAGFLCIASGQGTVCAELCPLPGPNTCAPGLICGSVDIRGYGVCF